jgi:hypothetical protein
VLREQPPVARGVAPEERERRAVAVLRHHAPRARAHDVVAEHAHVVARRLQQQDVDVGCSRA